MGDVIYLDEIRKKFNTKDTFMTDEEEMPREEFDLKSDKELYKMAKEWQKNGEHEKAEDMFFRLALFREHSKSIREWLKYEQQIIMTNEGNNE